MRFDFTVFFNCHLQSNQKNLIDIFCVKGQSQTNLSFKIENGIGELRKICLKILFDFGLSVFKL